VQIVQVKQKFEHTYATGSHDEKSWQRAKWLELLLVNNRGAKTARC